MSRVTLLVAVIQVAALLFVGSAGVQGAESAPPDRPAAVDHLPGVSHAAVPKRLEAAIEIDMDEFSFATPDGLRNPTFTIPVGATVGIHLHNEGRVTHELALGRRLVMGQDGVAQGYDESLFAGQETDVFFYYGEAKAELEGARFEEIEVDPGIRDIWLRLTFSPEMAGEWELGCFVPGHYEAGMHATLVIQ